MAGNLVFNIPRVPIGNQSARLFAVSVLLLFAEIMSIRWIGIEVPVLRIFPNLTLTSIFIGASIGLATYQRPKPSEGLLLLAACSTIVFLIGSNYLQLYELTLRNAEGLLISTLLIGVAIVNLTIIFVCLGRALGSEFEGMPALKAYAINLLGSMAGVALFAIISWLWWPPAIWLGIVALIIWLLSGKKYLLPLALGLMVFAAIVYKDKTWSPYGKLQVVMKSDVRPGGSNDYVMCVNGEFFHGGYHFSPLTDIKELAAMYRGSEPEKRRNRAWLEVPFQCSSNHDKVLVLGAGSGNDVSCALLHGVKHVDAVEIDPFIANCGFNRHPDHPYKDQRVSVHVEDARSFLRYSKEKFDIIQFAYLDPGRTLRMSSFLRSDNFVYTKEAMEAALAHLTDKGIISISFATGGSEPATRRLYKTIDAAWGHKFLSLVQDPHPGWWGGCLFIFGPGLKPVQSDTLKAAELHEWPAPGETINTRVSTDDWPFLYLEYSKAAIVIYIFVLVSAAILPFMIFRQSLPTLAAPIDTVPMFILGVAFMLMETKAITELALLFGPTWIVSSVVIMVILSLSFLGTVLVDRLAIAQTLPCYVGIVLTLLLQYFFHVPNTADVDPIVISCLSALIICLPVFFSGMVFSILFRRTKQPVMSLSANVLGVAFGGLLENLCIVTGIKNLSLLALLLYLCSALPGLCWRRPATRADLPDTENAKP
jgi:hypothetical protein